MKNCALYSDILTTSGFPHGFFPPGCEFLLHPGNQPVFWERLRLPKQVHGTDFASADEVKLREADGVYTTTPHFLVGVATADCVPLIVAFPQGVMVIHAGWRGIAHGILERSVMFLRNRFAIHPHDLLVAIGPGASGCCYEVGEEVAQALGFPCRRQRIDLRQSAELRLRHLGIRKIETVGGCTICSGPPWASYRREGNKAQRNYAIAGLCPNASGESPEPLTPGNLGHSLPL